MCWGVREWWLGTELNRRGGRFVRNREPALSRLGRQTLRRFPQAVPRGKGSLRSSATGPSTSTHSDVSSSIASGSRLCASLTGGSACPITRSSDWPTISRPRLTDRAGPPGFGPSWTDADHTCAGSLWPQVRRWSPGGTRFAGALPPCDGMSHMAKADNTYPAVFLQDHELHGVAGGSCRVRLSGERSRRSSSSIHHATEGSGRSSRRASQVGSRSTPAASDCAAGTGRHWRARRPDRAARAARRQPRSPWRASLRVG